MSVRKLRKFRQECERQSGKKPEEIELPLLHVLDDICVALGLGRAARRKVLGRRGIQKLEDIRSWRVTLRK